jgi:hypothetical protein
MRGGCDSARNLAECAGSVARKAKRQKGTRSAGGGGVFEGVNGVVILGRNERNWYLGNLSVRQTLSVGGLTWIFFAGKGWRTGIFVNEK